MTRSPLYEVGRAVPLVGSSVLNPSTHITYSTQTDRAILSGPPAHMYLVYIIYTRSILKYIYNVGVFRIGDVVRTQI